MITQWLKRKSAGGVSVASTPKMTDLEFKKISELIMSRCGIQLHAGKQELVKARLGKRLRALDLKTWKEYLAFLQQDREGDEIVSMLDAISTNLTSFFREKSHYDYLAQAVLPGLLPVAAKNGRQLRFWSAGCSTGEEPYTLALVLAENIPNIQQWDIKILGTDLSTRVLAKAKAARYSAERFQDMPAGMLNKYFTAVQTEKQPAYQVNDNLRKLVYFARMNFMEPWPLRGPFDIIFCRNVMIYFKRDTREQMIRQFWSLLKSGGYLFIGHSESLTGMQHDFKYLQPSTYRKS